MKPHQLIHQDSGNQEWFTDPRIIEAARKAMGSIDLDPASCIEANKVVRAARFFTKEDNGLEQKWLAENVWLNWPFGRIENPLWVSKLIREWGGLDVGSFRQCCCICFAATSEKWFQPLMIRPQCFLSPRTNYYTPNGKKVRGVTKGSVVTYIGTSTNTHRFAAAFEPFGTIKIRYERKT